MADPKATIDSYVVTPQLAGAFGHALDLVSAAVSQGKSRAAYLHGSFGSGKSHFMAVLHALLQHEPAARAKAELADVIAAHDQVLLGKRFLLVPLHLIGATSLESAIFEGYLDRIGQAPEAPLPPLFVAEPVFENADGLRATMGDAAFFAKLNSGGGDGWGDLGGSTWDPGSYATARRAPVGGPTYVQPSEQRGKSRWQGTAAPLSPQLCRAIRSIATGAETGARLSRRAAERLPQARNQVPTTKDGATVVVDEAGRRLWWTYAGLRANLTLATALPDAVAPGTTPTNLALVLRRGVDIDQIRALISRADIERARPRPAGQEPKFAAWLPPAWVDTVVTARVLSVDGAQQAAVEPVDQLHPASGPAA